MGKTLKAIGTSNGYPFKAKQIPSGAYPDRTYTFDTISADWVYGKDDLGYDAEFYGNGPVWEHIPDDQIADLTAEVADLKATITTMLEDMANLEQDKLRLQTRLSEFREKDRKQRRLLEHADTFRSVVSQVALPEDFSAKGLATQDPKMVLLRMAAKVYRQATEVE